jgi:DNA-binding MarR family transcriptional regulator
MENNAMDYKDNCMAINALLQRANSKFAKATVQQFAGQNLTMPQISILLLLDKCGTMKVSEISQCH